ncbi:phage tail tube protein [Variovorax sp. J22P168]|uniref:phage tail tube protein n=1 Tax=Variovorax jilinensis TaxID=3053513 RepID=UPI00257897BC|nr:phage tail tube protein [Variovorax sp. J22P168]MDM0011986.1 phage tail tube protein [Variovorax sp. J22P168]
MTVQTVAGTSLRISDKTPIAFTVAAYAELDYEEIGEVTDGGSHGRTYAEVTHQPINSRGTQKFKGSFNEGTKTLQLAIDDDDLGQLVLKEALHSDKDYSFAVVYQDGATDYFQAKVLSFEKATAGVDSIRSATVNLSLTTSKAGIGIVEAPAPAAP